MIRRRSGLNTLIDEHGGQVTVIKWMADAGSGPVMADNIRLLQCL